MKKTLLNIMPVVLLAGVITITSCNKDVVDRTTQYPVLTPASNDMNADSWRTILVTSPDAFTVAAPDAVGSTAYTADLSEIKNLQANLSSDQKANIQYWGAGAVMRWNEVMRDLVSKHNVPTVALPDGTYPAPNSANPFAYPEFPFSNPPYAARAYAYLSGAQYDALVTAYHFMKFYNRHAPYTNDSGIQALLPKTSLPSYPSQQAVVAGVSVAMMKMLFPTDVDYVQQLADQQMQAALASGSNTRGEWNAGTALGAQIAAMFITRAKGDGAGKAGGSSAEWATLPENATSRGDEYWVSQEMPARPPMLPMFGKVKPFLFDSTTVKALRPGPPNLVGSAQFKTEQAEVLSMSKNTSPAHQALVDFWADGVATYTPAGHWNAIAETEFVKQNYSEVRWARNYALLNMAENDAAICCWDTKYFYYNARPTQTNPLIKTLTGLPNFPSYTSGHSNFSSAAATVLNYLLPDRGSKFNGLAQQASLSRLYGAIHFRSDIMVGMQTGAAVGEYAVKWGQSDNAGIGN